ncbi:hypothetical protein LMG33818_002633 [Halomonadaceae bacterium LMG 33818]|uniref:GPO family capsid scaffolding protein n=1 Tax=Cernens ardua TaxID=3402176 RepID=UPI003EDC387F
MSKQFVVATAGATTDGREIQPEWIDQMAADYNPNVYAARVNCEHIRGMTPEGPFSALGDVTALSTGTDSAGNKTLIATIDPTSTLKKLSKDRQKIFTSCEIDTNFRGSGKAYLIGLAATDSPASIGTQMLKFSAGLRDEDKPLVYLKKKPDNLHSELVELSTAFASEDVHKPESTSVLDKVKNILLGTQKQTQKYAQENAEIREALEVLAQSNAELQAKLDKAASSDEFTLIKAEVLTLSKGMGEVRALLEKLDNTPATQFSRQLATGQPKPEEDTVDY